MLNLCKVDICNVSSFAQTCGPICHKRPSFLNHLHLYSFPTYSSTWERYSYFTCMEFLGPFFSSSAINSSTEIAIEPYNHKAEASNEFPSMPARQRQRHTFPC